jgi:hypothetical protein
MVAITPTLRRAAPRSLALALGLALAACGWDTVELVGVVERTSLELAAPVTEEIVDIPRPQGAHVGTPQELDRAP